MISATLRVAQIALTIRCRRPRSEAESVSPDRADDPLPSSSLGGGKRVSSLVLARRRKACLLTRPPISGARSVISATLRVARMALMTRCRRPRSETESVSPHSSSDQRRAIRDFCEPCVARLEHRSIAGVRRSIPGQPGHQDAESTYKASDGDPAGPSGKTQAEGCCQHDEDRVADADPAKQSRHAGSSQRRKRLRDITFLRGLLSGGPRLGGWLGGV